MGIMGSAAKPHYRKVEEDHGANTHFYDRVR